jgi:hypothetical protein
MLFIILMSSFLEPMHLGVLRVLIEQTLEISSVVKDPTQLGPSLVMEVKDSSHHSTSIPSQSQVDPIGSERGSAHQWGFSVGGAHHLRKGDSFCFEEVRSIAKLVLEVISITIAPFCSSCGRISLADLFIVVLGGFLKRDATLTEEAMSWEVVFAG